MILHLYGSRSGVITECSLTSAASDSLTTQLEDVTCRNCRRSMISRGVCPDCEGTTLVWATHPRKKASVPEGRLNSNDVETIFYLACGECSETLISQVNPEVVAAALTEAGWRP